MSHSVLQRYEEEQQAQAALSATLSDAEAGTLVGRVTEAECYKSDTSPLEQRIEQRFTPRRKTVDELLRKELSGQQLRAIDLLLSGLRDAPVARALGVHRVTIGRWRLYHPAFIAELNRRRDGELQRTGDRLMQVADQALAVLETRLKDDSRPDAQVRAAIGLLRMAGATRVMLRQGATSPDDVIEARAFDKRRRERQGIIDHGEREAVLIDLARRCESAEVESASQEAGESAGIFPSPGVV